MKRLAALFLGLLSTTPLQAAWTLESSECVATASPLITHVCKAVSNGRSVELHLVFLSAKKCTFKVIDNPRQDGDLASAMQSTGCLAGVNGGYFHPDRTPLGLLVSDGVTIHPVERARLLSGLLTVGKRRITLHRYTEIKRDEKLRQALQSGPFLIDHGKPVSGLNTSASATRTVVLGNGGDVWALLICESVTLAEMAEILTTDGIFSELKIDRALNLDGGSSTGMWIKSEPLPFYRREFKTVRDYLGIIPR